ncbi:redox-regulated ATPase YchF [Candidatus Woesearchaeota archaeon]|nr:redox-regulated ATPase YchF [Candidatus Woesearchaeota archaeon]
MLIGVVGKTNTGKSTFFKAATLAEVEIANRPFVTIKPHHGCGFVKVECPEKDFGVKCNPKTGFCLEGKRFVPIDLLDVAGLVPGAHKGIGLGNKFLDDLRQADVLIHVIDVGGSTNEKGEPVKPFSYDPLKDVVFLENEIDLWFYGLLKKDWHRIVKEIELQNVEAKVALAEKFSGLKISEEMIDAALKAIDKRLSRFSDEDLLNFAKILRKKSKPMIIAANKADVDRTEENIKRLEERFKDYIIVPCSAESELALREAVKHGFIRYIPGENDFTIVSEDKLSDEQKRALTFIKEKVLHRFGSTGVQEVIDAAVYSLLKQMAVFPVATRQLSDKEGNVLPDCFIIPQGTTAGEFAFKIHTDIGKNFIKAYDLRTKKFIGKDYQLNHRDVIQIITK